MKVAVIGWELPPAFSGGLGVHTINLFGRLAGSISIDIYVPRMRRLGNSYPFREHGAGIVIRVKDCFIAFN